MADGPPGRRAGGGGRARDAARPAHARSRTLADVAERARAPRASARRRSRSSAPVAALRERLAWLERAPAARPHGRGHARAGAGERARRAAARRSAPTVVEAPAIRIEPLAAPSSPTSPATTSSCVTSRTGAELLLDRAARRPRARRPHRRGDRPRHRARAAGARRSSPTSCPSAPSPRGSSRRWPTCRSHARADRARGRGARRAPRRAARARRGGRRRSRSTRPSPSRSTTRPATPPRRADYVTFTSASTGALLRRGGRTRSTARGSPRSGPATSAELRAHGARARPRGRPPHARRAGRRAAGDARSVGDAASPITFLSDYGLARRVRRRRPRA